MLIKDLQNEKCEKIYKKNRKVSCKPIIKFNNGNGAILCNKCSVIIKENLTKEEFEGKTDLLFCSKCEKIVYKND